MHSSRVDFSSLHTQQGFTFAAASPGGLRPEARLFGVLGWEGIASVGTVATGEDENQPIFELCGVKDERDRKSVV